MCFNGVVNIRNGYSRARYGGEPGRICPPVKHRQSHLVDPTIDRSRGQYCRDRDCRIGDAFLGMQTWTCWPHTATMTAQQDLNVEALRLMSLQCSLQRRALAMVLGVLSYCSNMLCNWERSCPRQLGSLDKLIRPVMGRLISSLVAR
jgi:hypothetical protein